MRSPLASSSTEPVAGRSRRDFFKLGTVAAAFAGLGGQVRRAAAASLEFGANLYRSIGVKPLINAKGTFTIITGSQTLPEVKTAMVDASRAYVQMDELMDGVGRRLAELTGAEWGIVTDGCAAALTHCTSASLAGTDPERMQHLPNLEGMKSEVVIPAYSRNVYDHAIRMLGREDRHRRGCVGAEAAIQRAYGDGLHSGRARATRGRWAPKWWRKSQAP